MSFKYLAQSRKDIFNAIDNYLLIMIVNII